MSKYSTVIIPAYDEFSDRLRDKIDCHSNFHSIGINAFTDILALTRELVDKAYNAGYADCEDKHQQKAEFLKEVQKAGGTK